MSYQIPFISLYQDAIGEYIPDTGERTTIVHLAVYGLLDAADYGHGAVAVVGSKEYAMDAKRIANILELSVEKVNETISDLLTLGWIKPTDNNRYQVKEPDLITIQKDIVKSQLW